uniref:Aminopeptidase n=1 Tax=Trichoplusia ni TaxID=7111 RepID=A4D0J3_TRINI|nr:aminopeptidase N1 [Trichoplusia ni]
MANRFTLLLLGVALAQGILAYSPIEMPEDEWQEYRNLMRDPTYRLVRTTEPETYKVTLTPYFDTNDAKAFTFDGEVEILIKANQAVSEIVLHCNDLTISKLTVTTETSSTDLAEAGQTFTCEANTSFLRIKTTSPLEAEAKYVIKSEFTGNLQTNMRGFYRSWYVDSSGNKRWMATTQFQPGHARQAFPCYDEPSFKALFDITIKRLPDFSETLSNMPIKTRGPLTDGRIAETFHTTPKTSTYLLAFIVSHYKEVATGTDLNRPFKIYARDNAKLTGDWSLDIGERLLEEMEKITDVPYYGMALNMDMKQAAIPDFSAGAMENWGLLTYREALILYDPKHSNHFYKQRVANIVSHEIAHMWFGNYVTCAWWDNLWLNEGFARFYQYYLTDRVDKNLGFDTRFIVEQLHTSLLSDSGVNAHPLTDENVSSPTTVSAHFSTITYAKGASVLRMTQHLLGNSTFEKGLRSYLKARRYDVATPDDLFDALQEAATLDGALTQYPGATVKAYFETWTSKAGHPLLTVTVGNDGTMKVTQERFGLTPVTTFEGTWQIPITWTSQGNVDFYDLKPSRILTGTSTTIDVGTNQRGWLIFNKQQTGFYRVDYDPITWAHNTMALRNAEVRKDIHVYNRAQIVDDVFLLARSERMTYRQAFNILSFLEFEDEYAPWIAAIAGFNFAVRRLAHDEAALAKLQAHIHSTAAAVVNRLGYEDKGGDDNFMDDLLRMNLMQFLCNVNHEKCIEEGVKSFQSWKVNEAFHIPANHRPWVYCAGLRAGDASDFDVFWSRYLKEDLASEKVVMVTAAGCTGDEASLRKFLNAIVDDKEDIRPQDYSVALNSAIASNEVNTLRAFEWLKTNVDQTVKTLGSINSPLSTISSRLLNDAQINTVETWLNENAEIIGASAVAAGRSGIATSKSNIEWLTKRKVEFEDYFETGFEDPLAPPVTETEASTSSPTAAPSTTEAPASASTAALSVVAMLVTLAVNMV